MTIMRDPFRDLRLYATKSVIAPDSSASIICDLGCGDGSFIRFIQDDYANSNIVAVDVNRSKIRKAAKFIRASFIIADVRHIPLRQSSCDMVSCLEVVEHMKTTKSFFNDIIRILKRGGIFVISTPNIHSLSTSTAKIAYSISRKKYAAFDTTHTNLYWPERLVKELEESSFHDLHLYGFWLLPVGLSWPPLLLILSRRRCLLKILSKIIRNKFLAKTAFITIVKCKRGM
jgi:2-polyprenyl-3-methyl-5-hydroxy-6-metoxy-1,4-benzoquinol methylase